MHDRTNVIKSYMGVLGVLLVLSSVSAKDETLDIQTFLPLFERNSLGRKTLDVSYSSIFRSNQNGEAVTRKADVHLVFDADTEKYREEVKTYDNPNNTDVYDFEVNIWDGNEDLSWCRQVSKKIGYRALRLGIYEAPGTAVVRSQPWRQHLLYMSFYYDVSFRQFSKSVSTHNPKLGNIIEDTITIETEWNKFQFSKRTGALEKVGYHARAKNVAAWRTYELSSHVEVSGVWIPLQVVVTDRAPDGNVYCTLEIVVDPKTLRLLDKVEDSSIFNEVFPAGTTVNDLIRKKIYTVTTADTLPNDVEALTKFLERMVEQALEQKEEAEKEMREKK